MRSFREARKLPRVPAVYVFWSRDANALGTTVYPVYVGLTKNLNDRICQHLLRRDSSVTTGTTAVMLNAQYLTELQWWSIPEFEDKGAREAAEEIAFRKFDPVLRDRGAMSHAAQVLMQNNEFCARMETLFSSTPSGVLRFDSLEDVFPRLAALEGEVKELRSEIARLREGR